MNFVLILSPFFLEIFAKSFVYNFWMKKRENVLKNVNWGRSFLGLRPKNRLVKKRSRIVKTFSAKKDAIFRKKLRIQVLSFNLAGRLESYFVLKIHLSLLDSINFVIKMCIEHVIGECLRKTRLSSNGTENIMFSILFESPNVLDCNLSRIFIVVTLIALIYLVNLLLGSFFSYLWKKCSQKGGKNSLRIKLIPAQNSV